jgi:hypothetical protein
MKKNIVKAILVIGALLAGSIVTSQRATATWPVCPPFCSGR